MYTAQITRAHKGAILLLLDLSGSMAEEVCYEGKIIRRSEALANAVNSLLQELINRSHRDRFVGDYFDVAIVGYGGEEPTDLLGGGWKSIVEINNTATETRVVRLVRKLPDGQSLITLVNRRVWIEPVAKGRTPMGAALAKAKRLCHSWCRKHPGSFPPIVINISDGEATDASPEKLTALATALKAEGTNDGNVLLMNIHLATPNEIAPVVVRFPGEDEAGRTRLSRHARLLYDISSPMPELYNSAVAEITGGRPPFRGICYNAPIDDLLSLLAVGSLSINRLL